MTYLVIIINNVQESGVIVLFLHLKLWNVQEGGNVHVSHRLCMGKIFYMAIRLNHVSIKNSFQA